MEKRKHPRISLKNLSVDASDGIGFFHGEIFDVSRFGVCLVDVPKKVNVKTNKMIVVISGFGKNFKMNVMPRWSSDDGPIKSVGAEIMNPPWGWTEFVQDFESKEQVDIRGVKR